MSNWWWRKSTVLTISWCYLWTHHYCTYGTSSNRFFSLPNTGRVLSHGYLTTGIIPDKIALPTLIHILLASGVIVLLNILMEMFIDYISTSERSLLRPTLEITAPSFSTNMLSQLITLLTRGQFLLTWDDKGCGSAWVLCKAVSCYYTD